MKTIKIAILFTTMSLFTFTSYNTAEARDCSNPKGFHAKMMCKLSGSSVTAAETKETKVGDGTTSWIKKFLGKKNNKVTGNKKKKDNKLFNFEKKDVDKSYEIYNELTKLSNI